MQKVATYIRVSDHSNSDNAVINQAEKVKAYCEDKGYEICDSATVIGDRKTAYPKLKELLSSAKDKNVEKIVMASTNRIVGTIDELKTIKVDFDNAEVKLETLDGSHMAIDTPNLVADFLAKADEEAIGELDEIKM